MSWEASRVTCHGLRAARAFAADPTCFLLNGRCCGWKRSDNSLSLAELAKARAAASQEETPPSPAGASGSLRL
ncbi:hypothetical protein Y1Q_0007514 [Alligator mississippiensis]|uniref:Uncharacterized protein n=1 Tax=Alligator mississippiensis TaxID=8496 RepID=A0A151M4Z0_ALLMI|nr:hypothetical protein Y1Q_0007514 [Alligator mississippiensis]